MGARRKGQHLFDGGGQEGGGCVDGEKHTVVMVAGDDLTACVLCLGGDQDGCDHAVVAGLVKVFEIERVVPNLIHRSTVEERFTHLELDDKNGMVDQCQYVDAFAQTRHDELKENCAAACERFQFFLKNLYL